MELNNKTIGMAVGAFIVVAGVSFGLGSLNKTHNIDLSKEASSKLYDALRGARASVDVNIPEEADTVLPCYYSEDTFEADSKVCFERVISLKKMDEDRSGWAFGEIHVDFIKRKSTLALQ